MQLLTSLLLPPGAYPLFGKDDFQTTPFTLRLRLFSRENNVDLQIPLRIGEEVTPSHLKAFQDQVQGSLLRRQLCKTSYTVKISSFLWPGTMSGIVCAWSWQGCRWDLLISEKQLIELRQFYFPASVDNFNPLLTLLSALLQRPGLELDLLCRYESSQLEKYLQVLYQNSLLNNSLLAGSMSRWNNQDRLYLLQNCSRSRQTELHKALQDCRSAYDPQWNRISRKIISINVLHYLKEGGAGLEPLTEWGWYLQLCDLSIFSPAWWRQELASLNVDERYQWGSKLDAEKVRTLAWILPEWDIAEYFTFSHTSYKRKELESCFIAGRYFSFSDFKQMLHDLAYLRKQPEQKKRKSAVDSSLLWLDYLAVSWGTDNLLALASDPEGGLLNQGVWKEILDTAQQGRIDLFTQVEKNRKGFKDLLSLYSAAWVE